MVLARFRQLFNKHRVGGKVNTKAMASDGDGSLWLVIQAVVNVDEEIHSSFMMKPPASR
jgi:hypothetical protein